MRREGFQALDSPSHRLPRPAAVGPTGRRPQLGGAAQTTRPSTSPTASSPGQVAGAGEAAARARLDELGVERQGLHEESARLTASLSALNERLQAQQAQLAEAGAALADALARVTALETDLAAAHVAASGAKEAARAHAQSRSALETELRAVKTERNAADLRLLLRRRGLADEALQVRALEGLLHARPAATATAIFRGDHQALRSELERTALVCEGADCQPMGKDTPVIRVAPADCECCGGSDIRRAFGAFVAACRAAGMARVTIVGGSPSYRDKLRSLGRELAQGLALEVVQQERPGEGKRAQAITGLVVIWGATEVDHSTTGHYRGAGDRTIAVHHRGIAGMLSQVSQKL